MNLLFDFTVDKENLSIHITREFAADQDLVWDAFTKAEMLDQWMGFQSWRHQTKEMDFREGGRWLHAMISPENVARWSLSEFIEVRPKSSFSCKNSFCDEDGSPLNNGSSLTKNFFEAGAEVTTVRIVKIFDNLSTLEMMASGGFKEGTVAGYANLDKYLHTLVTHK